MKKEKIELFRDALVCFEIFIKHKYYLHSFNDLFYKISIHDYSTIFKINLGNENINMNKVFTYVVDMDKYYDNLSLFWEYLSINEQEQAKKYYDKVLADRYIISHGILRSILSYYINNLLPA